MATRNADLAVLLSEFVSDLSCDSLPDEVIREARFAITDTVASALAAVSEPSVEPVVSLAAAERGPVRVWGTAIHTSVGAAALVLGTMAHALEIDDCNGHMLGHPSAPVVPALLTLAETLDVTGADVVAAYVAAVEVAGRVGRVATTEHNRRGWHTTSTIGTLAAAMGCARLLGLDAGKTAHALGVAVSLACGVRANFGTPTKPLHAGVAAQQGILAARLAAAGLAARPSALEGHEGFFDLFVSGTPQAVGAVGRIGEPYEVMGNYYKLYPTCSIIQPALDEILHAVRTGRARPEDIQEIVYVTTDRGRNIMRFANPADVFEARFSPEFLIATAVVRGRLGHRELTADALSDPRIQNMMRKVQVRVYDSGEPSADDGPVQPWHNPAEVIIRHAPGSDLRAHVTTALGRPDRPLGPDGLRKKFDDCLQTGLPTDARDRLWIYLQSLDQQDVVSLDALTSPR